MIPKILQAQLKQIHRDVDTVRILVDFGRGSEAVPVALRAWESMSSIELPPGTRSYGPGFSISDAVKKLKSASSDPAGASAETLRELQFDAFAEKLRDLAGAQLRHLRKKHRTAADARWTAAAIVLPLAVMLAAGAAIAAHIRLMSRHGLRAEFYSGNNFEHKIAEGRSSSLHFTHAGEISRKLPPDHFSVRWTGHIHLPKSGRYRFAVDHDNGVRLYIDGKMIINDWTDTVGMETSKAIQLKEGPHQIKAELFENVGEERIHLYYYYANDSVSRLVPFTWLTAD